MNNNIGWSKPTFFAKRKKGYPEIRFPKTLLGKAMPRTVFEALSAARVAAGTTRDSRRESQPVTIYQAEGEYRRRRSSNPPIVVVPDTMDYGDVTFSRAMTTGTRYECCLRWDRKAPNERTLIIGRTSFHGLPLLRRLRLASWARRAIAANIDDPTIVDWKGRPCRIPMTALERMARHDYLLDALISKTKSHDTVPSFEILSGYSPDCYLYETGRATDVPISVELFVTTARINSYINLMLYYYKEVYDYPEVVDRLDDDIPNAHVVEVRIRSTHDRGVGLVETLNSVDGKIGVTLGYEVYAGLVQSGNNTDRNIIFHFESAEAATIVRTIFSD